MAQFYLANVFIPSIIRGRWTSESGEIAEIPFQDILMKYSFQNSFVSEN